MDYFHGVMPTTQLANILLHHYFWSMSKFSESIFFPLTAQSTAAGQKVPAPPPPLAAQTSRAVWKAEVLLFYSPRHQTRPRIKCQTLQTSSAAAARSEFDVRRRDNTKRGGGLLMRLTPPNQHIPLLYQYPPGKKRSPNETWQRAPPRPCLFARS